MKESVTKFDLEAAFKALDDIEIPSTGGVKANKPALTEIFSKKTKLDTLLEEYYDISNMSELDEAKEAREAEVAQAKLARIEKIVDLDAESPEDLLPSYVGKFIMQCPQCMMLFYKNPEDVEASEEDPNTVNVNEVCQHCGNETGYMLIGKVGEATQEEMAEYTEEETVDVTSTEEDEEELEITEDEEVEESEEDLDFDLDALDLELEDEEEEKTEESFTTGNGSQQLMEELTEDAEMEVSADDFEKLINSPEFKKPMSDNEARAMMNELEGEKEEVNEAVEVNNETLRYAVINADGTYAGVPCTSEEEARELAAQQEGRIIVELGALKESNIAFKKKDDFDEVSEEVETLEEGVLDKLKNKLKDKFSDTVEKVSNKLKSREEKADWILANAMKDYDEIEVDTRGQLVPDKNNQKFKTFVIVGFTNRNSKGNLIKTAPDFDDKNLVIGKNGVNYTDKYTEADKFAKGWSMRQGNGPAFIYLAKDKEDANALFLCEYFMGELKNDQLEKYFKIIKDNLKGAELMDQSGVRGADEEVTDAEEVSTTESLDIFMAQVENLQEDLLEKLISDSLVESYGNVAGFRLTECSYLNEKLNIDGTVYFTSGRSRKTTYSFSEALTGANQVNIQGINEKLGLDKQFVLSGRIEDKTLITESFKSNKK